MVEILKRSLKVLNSNLWSLIGICTISSIFIYLFSKIPVIGILLATLPYFTLIKILLKSIKGEYMSFSSLLNLEFKSYIKLIGFTLLSIVIVVLPLLLLIFSLFFFISLFLSFNLSHINSLFFEGSVLGSLIITLFLFIILPLLLIAYSLIFGFLAYACVDDDFSNLSFIETIQYSFNALNGCRLKYILLLVVTILSFLIIVPLTFGLGIFYLLPLSILSFMSLYEHGKEINNLIKTKVSFLDISEFETIEVQ